MECTICKLQYVGKSEWPINIRNDVFRTDGLDCDKHFQETGHNFDKNAKFTIIEELKNKNRSPLAIRKLLEQREDAWIIKLRTLGPDGFNEGLNDPTLPYENNDLKSWILVHFGNPPLILQP